MDGEKRIKGRARVEGCFLRYGNWNRKWNITSEICSIQA